MPGKDLNNTLGKLYRYLKSNNIVVVHRNDMELIKGVVKQLTEGEIDASNELLDILDKLSGELIK